MHLPTTRNRPGARSDSPRAEEVARGVRQTSGNDTCDLLSEDVNLFRQIQLNPLYAFSVMAELQHANLTASRRKRQGSLEDVEIPNEVCREVVSRLSTTESNNLVFVSCPSVGRDYVVYQCHFNRNRYPRYLIQAEPCHTGGCLSCHNTDSLCGDHNTTVIVAERSGNCNWNAISIEIRLGCRCNIPPRRLVARL